MYRDKAFTMKHHIRAGSTLESVSVIRNKFSGAWVTVIPISPLFGTPLSDNSYPHATRSTCNKGKKVGAWIAHALMRYLACNPTLADILFLVASIQHDPGELWRTSLAPRPHSRPSEQKEYLYHLLQLPIIPLVGRSASNEQLPAPEIWNLDTNNRVLSLSWSTASHCHDQVLCSSFTSDSANELFQVVKKRAFPNSKTSQQNFRWLSRVEAQLLKSPAGSCTLNAQQPINRIVGELQKVVQILLLLA